MQGDSTDELVTGIVLEVEGNRAEGTMGVVLWQESWLSEAPQGDARWRHRADRLEEQRGCRPEGSEGPEGDQL